VKDAVGPGARAAWLPGPGDLHRRPHRSERARPDRLLDTAPGVLRAGAGAVPAELNIISERNNSSLLAVWEGITDKAAC
jgi:hypothetical protein